MKRFISISLIIAMLHVLYLPAYATDTITEPPPSDTQASVYAINAGSHEVWGTTDGGRYGYLDIRGHLQFSGNNAVAKSTFYKHNSSSYPNASFSLAQDGYIGVFAWFKDGSTTSAFGRSPAGSSSSHSVTNYANANMNKATAGHEYNSTAWGYGTVGTEIQR